MLQLRQPVLLYSRSLALPTHRLSRLQLHSSSAHNAANAYFRGGRPVKGFTQTRLFHGSHALRAPDYYSILGASPSDSKDELKKKYRKLAKRYHPDTSTEDDAKDKFQQVSEAWECLKDDNERTLYDSYGHDGYIAYKKSGGAGPQPGGTDGINLEDLFRNMGGFGDMFGERMRGQQSPRGATRGRPVAVRVDLTFMEAIEGCVKDISYSAFTACGSCSGKGTDKGYAPEYKSCNACNGRGTRQTVLGGMMHIEQLCEVCGGSGMSLSNKCSTCQGSGLEKSQKDTRIDIPAGVDTGMQLSQPGAGNAGERGGPPGDLIVNIHVARDSRFIRDGLDIHYECPMTLAQSLLGDTISVPTISGEVEMTVTPGTSNGEVRRLRGKGVPQVNNRSYRGDQYVKLKVIMPENLTERQRELILEFEKEEIEKDTAKCRPALSENLKAALNRIKSSFTGLSGSAKEES